MVVETIYVVRHGYRSNWVVDPQTGEYSSTVRSPTGIASDPALASYGVQQAEQLGRHLESVDPPVDRVYSSPFYRCIQTLSPFTNALAAKAADSKTNTPEGRVTVHLEPGLGEFYGLARFDHPSPATLQVLEKHFPHLAAENDPIIVPSTKGESIPQLHDRVAYCLRELIAQLDADPSEPKSLLICTHAASMICIGRALTGMMPEDEGAEDFNCFTCSFTRFDRKSKPIDTATRTPPPHWDPAKPDEVPDIKWRNGNGVAGGWTCTVNGDCSFLTNGEERGWNFNIEKEQFSQKQDAAPETPPEPTTDEKFSGDESFLRDPNAFNDAKNTSAVETIEEEGAKGDGSRL